MVMVMDRKVEIKTWKQTQQLESIAKALASPSSTLLHLDFFLPKPWFLVALLFRGLNIALFFRDVDSQVLVLKLLVHSKTWIARSWFTIGFFQDLDRQNLDNQVLEKDTQTKTWTTKSWKDNKPKLGQPSLGKTT